MRILLDQGAPAPLIEYLSEHLVSSAHVHGWESLTNGELLRQAEQAGFEVLVTTDQSLKYQQNLSSRKICIVVLSTTSWPRIQRSVTDVIAALGSAGPGNYIEVPIP